MIKSCFDGKFSINKNVFCVNYCLCKYFDSSDRYLAKYTFLLNKLIVKVVISLVWVERLELLLFITKHNILFEY